MAKNDAVILLSGGLDSATVLAMANHDGRRCHALSFVYGQRHAAETERARSVARALGVASFRVATLDLRVYGGSALTSDDYAVPKDNAQPGDGPVPITYVPARNTIFLSHALALAEVLGAEEIWIGVNAVDYSGYPDCRPEFVEAFERLANVATAAGAEGGTRFRIRAPLMRMSKAEIIRQGTALGVDYGMTLSCYDPEPGEKACGRCDACRLRAKGFAEAKIPDPTRYVED